MEPPLRGRCLEGKTKRDKLHVDRAVPLIRRKVRVTCIWTTPRLREFAVEWTEGVANAAVALSAATFRRTAEGCTDGDCLSQSSDPSAGDLEHGLVETGQPCYRSLMGPEAQKVQLMETHD